jgi:hypothetical protein
MKPEDVKKFTCAKCDRKQPSCEATFCAGAKMLMEFGIKVYAGYSTMKNSLDDATKVKSGFTTIKDALGDLYK